MDKGQEHHVKFLEAGEDATKAFETAKEPLDFVASLVHGPIVLPCGTSVLLGRNDRDKAQIESQLAGIVSFVGSIHQQVNRPSCRSQTVQKFASFRCVVGVTGRKREGNCCSGVGCHQMNLGRPATSRLAYGLRTVFFRAPVPSGCTLIDVLSRETASILTRTT